MTYSDSDQMITNQQSLFPPLLVKEVRLARNLLQVSVIVCAYTQDRWLDLQQAVRSLREQTVPPCEIILVIDHNHDLTLQAREAFPDLKVIENQEARGLSGARNTGMAHCSGQVVAFMDEDATAAPNWIETLLAGYVNPAVVGVGGEVKPSWQVPAPDWFPEEFHWVVGCSYKGLPSIPSAVRNPIGCNMSFRREALTAAGGFRNGIGRVGTLPVGCEETEAAIRIRQLRPGAVYLYQPGAVVHHRVPAWRVNLRYFARRCYAEGLSKALISRFVGSGDGLSSERSYATKVLPRGVLAGLKQAVFSGQLAGLKRALAIIAGLLLTTAGFVVGTVSQLGKKSSHELAGSRGPLEQGNPTLQEEDFKPVKIVEVELSRPLPAIHQEDEGGQVVYQRAMVLARLHSRPIGVVKIDFEAGEITPVRLAAYLWGELGLHINLHLREDHLAPEVALTRVGLAPEVPPQCVVDRQESLRTAPLISIILATRDRAASMAVTLKSLLAQDYPRFEIIVVDNASKTTETRDYIAQHQAEFQHNHVSLRYVREEVPGLAVAHNRGLQEVNGEITAFTDDDVVADRYWLAEIARGFRAAEAVACVTGLVIPLELDTPAQVLFEEFGGFTKGFDPQVYDLNNHRPANPLFPYTAGRFGTGANMAFRTDFLKQTGGFDPALGVGTPALGADDMAAFFQAIILGRQLVYQPAALVFHQHRRTYEGLQRQMLGYGVGLTAFLTKCILDNPGRILDIAPKVPAGIRYALAPDSAKNQHKSYRYPPELERIERKGMLYGPAAYLRSRWRYRKLRLKFSAAGGNQGSVEKAGDHTPLMDKS